MPKATVDRKPTFIVEWSPKKKNNPYNWKQKKAPFQRFLNALGNSQGKVFHPEDM